MFKKILLLTSLLVILLSCTNNGNKLNIKVMKPPFTFRGDTIDDYFGTKVADPYRWLEDENSDSTVAWVDREVEYTNNFLSQIPYRDKIKSRLSNLLNYERYGTPFIKNGKYFIFKNDGLQNQSVLYELDMEGNEGAVIIDPNKFSEDGTKSLSSLEFNKQGNYLAYLVAESGADWNKCKILDINTMQDLEDEINWIKFSGTGWYKDGFFYSRYPNDQSGKVSSKNENHKLYYHKIGTDQKEDKVWFEDPKHPNRNIYASTSEDENYLLMSQVESTTGNTFGFIDLNDQSRKVHQIVQDFDNDFSFVDNIGTKLFVLTNRNAPNTRLISIDANDYSEKNWKEIVPETTEPIQSVQIIGDHLFASYLKNAYSLVKIFDLNGNFIKDFELPGIGSAGGFSGEKGSKDYFFSFSSYLFPPTIYKMNTEDFTYKPFKSAVVDFNPDLYVTEQKWYESKDGTKVPMFITHKKDIKFDGNNPTLLYGYGGFNISLEPSFSATRLMLLEKGGVYVVANIRGGGEFGEEWHKAGTLERKQNVFDDFIAAAEYLVENKYTKPEKLAIEGGSNGGLLIGACMLQRPDLFGVAFPRVGVLDMLRYHKFTIGWAWATDYGKSDDEEEFNYLIKYSPVHNVKPAKYPATMIMTADHDDRVVPAHSFKFGAELQRNQRGDKPVLIRIEKKAGHGAGKPISKIIDEQADFYSFLFYNMGVSY